VCNAAQAVVGQLPMKRNRFIRLSGRTRSVNRELEDKAEPWPG
jgi:hypothetical protein